MTIRFVGQGLIGKSYADDMERRGHKGAKKGRGAAGTKFMRPTIEKNVDLLVAFGKDLDLLAGVHGKAALRKK